MKIHSDPLRADRTTTPLWRNTSFGLMWTSAAASGFGDRLIQLAAWSMLGVSLAGADASSIQAGVSFFFFLPYVILGPAAGWLADTLPRKWILLFCDEARAALLLLALLLVPDGTVAALGLEHHWKVFAIIAAVGVWAAVFSPAKAATIPQIVSVQQLQSANAIVLGIAVIASLIGFAIGGPLIQKVSLSAGLIVAIVSYAVSGSFFAFLRLRRHEATIVSDKPSELHRFLNAMVYVRRHHRVGQLILLSMIFWAAATVLMAAIAALCKTRYGISDETVISHTATMMAAMGAGMLFSSLCIAWANSRRESMWVAMAGLFFTGLFMIAMAVNRSYNIGLLLSFGTGLCGNTAMVCVATMTQSITPDYIRGRVFGIRDLFNTTSAVLVNLWIWQLPHADQVMIVVLYAVASTLAMFAGWGLWLQMTSGPFYRSANVAWRLCRAYTLVWHRLQWIGRENVPSQGPVILAPNHTTGLDPLLVQAAVRRPIRWVMFRGYQFRLLGPLWRILQPVVMQDTGNGIKQLREMVRRLADDQVLGLFPEGAAQRTNRQLKPFQQGIGLLARRSGAIIVPVWIEGTPQTQNMLWHFLKPSRSTVVFGKPFKPDETMSHQQVTDELRRRMVVLFEKMAAA